MNKMKVVKIIVAISVIMLYSPAVPLLFEEFLGKKNTLDIFETTLTFLFGGIYIAILHHIIYNFFLYRFIFLLLNQLYMNWKMQNSAIRLR